MASRLGTVLRRFAATAEQGVSHGPEVHGGGMKRWKVLTYVVALPGVVVCWLNAFMGSPEDEHGKEFKAYEHLRLRTKKFPWGDGNHSLFHNTHANPLPDGWEEHEE